MHVSQMRVGSLFSVADVRDQPLFLTIRDISREPIQSSGRKKCLLEFVETDSRLPLNTAHINTLITLTGSEESDQWASHQFALYNDPAVEFEERRVGGVRIRKLAAGEVVRDEGF